MKSFKKLLCLLPTALLVCGCNNQGSSEFEPYAEILSEYDFKNDFSNKQGHRGWYYYFGDPTEKLYYMTYHEDLCTFKGADFWSRIDPYQIEPGLNSEAVIGWKTPITASVHVKISFVRNPPDGFRPDQDGVWLYGFINSVSEGDEYLYSEEVKENYKHLHEIEFDTNVKKGDQIYFVDNPNSSNNNDNSIINIHIDIM